MVIMLIAHNVL